MTAYHEAGHAIVGVHVPEHDPVYKVTIIPRGRALGRHVVPARGGPLQLQQAPPRELDRHACSAAASPRSSSSAPTPSPPAPRTTSNAPPMLARNMVTKWGLSDQLGPLTYSEERWRGVPRPPGHAAQAGVGRNRARHRRGSAACHRHATTSAPGDPRDQSRQARTPWPTRSIKYETIDEQQIKDIMAGRASEAARRLG